MDTPLLSAQAAAALTSLTQQLSTLATEQRALLHSIQLTNTTLDELPAYNRVRPTFEAIPAYQKKLDRLRKMMVVQQQEVESLRRRATECREKRRENAEKVREWRKEEGVRDRTVLRARVRGEEKREERTTEKVEAGGEEGGKSRQESGEMEGVEEEGEPQEVASPRTVTVQKVVKKRKKARKVEM